MPFVLEAKKDEEEAYLRDVRNETLRIQDITLYLIYYEQVLTRYDSQEKMDAYNAYLNEVS